MLIYLYINKFNVRNIKMKKVVRLTESDLIRLVKRIIKEDNDSWESKYRNWANNKSGNPELAMNLMSRYKQLTKHPEMPVEYRNFYNLKDADELQDLIDEMEKVVEVNKKNQEISRVKHFGDYHNPKMYYDKYEKHKVKLGQPKPNDKPESVSPEVAAALRNMLNDPEFWG
jgi:hypothetical protein